jgi:hypothetical protein
MAITKTSSASYVIHPLNGDPIILDALNVRIPGNLTVSGTTTSVETTNTEIFDNIIRLNAGHTGAPTLNAGIEVERGDETDVQLRWNEGFQKWQISNDGATYGNIATAAASGSYLTDVVQDLTPQLGGNLDVNGQTILAASGNVPLEGNLQINHSLGVPSAVASTTVLYSATPGSAGSGLYVQNSLSTEQELVTKAKAIVFSLIL